MTVSPPTPRSPKITLVFYRSATGNEAVRDWLLGLSDINRACIGQDLMRVQWRWPVGMPLVRPMGSGLHEVRTSWPDGTIARVLICFHADEAYVLHGFIKKTNTTPKADLDMALKRKKEVDHG